MGTDEDGGVFLVKLDFGGLFLLGRSCSHRLILSAALSRNRVFFGDFLRLLTWEKWRFSNRSAPDDVCPFRRAPAHMNWKPAAVHIIRLFTKQVK